MLIAWATAAMGRRVGDLIDDQVICDEVGINKPDHRFFQRVLDKTGASRDEILYCAQSQYHDIGGAKSFGLSTVWIERRHAQPGSGATPAVAESLEPDIHVHNLAELMTVCATRVRVDESPPRVTLLGTLRTDHGLSGKSSGELWSVP